MSKKMKGIAFVDIDSAKLKYHTLLQDYLDLLKEVFDKRNRLEAAKGHKNRLLAELRFLRRRHTYLVETKTLRQQQEQLPPLPDLKHKGRVYAGKEVALRNATNVLGLNSHKVASSSMKEASLNKNFRKRRLSDGVDASAAQSNELAMYSSQTERTLGGIPIFDLNQASLPKHAPTFDLNEISMDDEVDYEDMQFEESRKVPLVLQMMNTPVI